jgi:glycosyltransferase involved in cell wall biosynthesis
MKKKLRIAMFVTNEYPTPIKDFKTIYAPIWITSQLAEGMVKKGHEVTLFASSDSETKANLESEGLVSLNNNKELLDHIKIRNLNETKNFYEDILVSKMYRMALEDKFDIIHVHPYKHALHFAPFTKTPSLITIHEPIDYLRKFMLSRYKDFNQVHYTPISNAQKKPYPELNYTNTVYNGIEISNYKFNDKPEDFAITAGRILPKKGIHTAIEIAKKANFNFKFAGTISDKKYWNEKIKPEINNNIEYLGIIPYPEIPEFYRRAKAFLFPIEWEEPFGLVMIEAMACGTPVIAFNKGSVPEVIKDGKTGFIVNNTAEAIEALKNIDKIDRKECRKHVEDNFTARKMINDYEKVYYEVINKK